MHVVFAPEAPRVYDRGLAILSRYAIRETHVCRLKPFNLRFHNRARFALAATIDTPVGPIHVWNVHLDTRLNGPDRIAQLAPVVQNALAVAPPKIIAGDFNTNDFYWLWNLLLIPAGGRQSDLVRRYMETNGFQVPLQRANVKFERFGMQSGLDLHPGAYSRAASFHDIAFSDHRAVVLHFNQKALSGSRR